MQKTPRRSVVVSSRHEVADIEQAKKMRINISKFFNISLKKVLRTGRCPFCNTKIAQQKQENELPSDDR